MRPPEYDELCDLAGFPLPASYHDFPTLAFEIEPDDPWNAFDAVFIGSLDWSFASPDYRLDAESYDEYAGTPAEGVVFAWPGVDGAQYVFLLDDTPIETTELPIARVCYRFD